MLKGTGRKGFTLIELLVVMAIILILAGLLTPGLFKAKQQANKVSCANNLKQVATALEIYYSANNTYPALIASLNQSAYLDDQNVLKCPVGTSYAFSAAPTDTQSSSVEIVRCTQHPSGGIVSLYKGGNIKIQ